METPVVSTRCEILLLEHALQGPRPSNECENMHLSVPLSQSLPRSDPVKQSGVLATRIDAHIGFSLDSAHEARNKETAGKSQLQV